MDMTEEFSFEDLEKDEFAEFDQEEHDQVTEFDKEELDLDKSEDSFEFDELSEDEPFTDPFAEEFDQESVINKSELESDISKKEIDRPKDSELKLQFSQDDIDKIVGYDDERRKSISFKDEVTEEIALDPEEKTDLNNEFSDFLQAPRISGTGKLRGDKYLYHTQNINETGNVVEIINAPADEKKHGAATVAVNRDDSGEVDHIEIVCNCGERIMLKFDYTDNLSGEQTIIYNKKVEPEPFYEEEIEKEFEEYKKEKEEEEEDFFATENIDSLAEGKKEEPQEEEIVWDDDFGVDEGEIDMGDIDLSGI